MTIPSGISYQEGWYVGPCSCGGTIAVRTLKDPEIKAAVVRHNRSLIHARARWLWERGQRSQLVEVA